MNEQTTAAIGARRAAPRATSTRWLVLSLVALGLLAAGFAAPPPLAADSEAEEQIEFGADMARRGLWKEALFRFLQAERLDPDNPRILNNVAVSYEALGLFDQALEYYQKALRLGPDERDLRSNYSRFAEFYQSFRPQEEPTAGAEVAADADEAVVDESGSEGVSE